MFLPPQASTVIISFLALWLFILTATIIKAYLVYRKLTSDIDKKDLALVLTKIKDNLKNIDQDITAVETAIEELRHEIKPHIQKLGFVRYNPFGNTGGDQSFCLCLMDKNDNGIMITSLHTRNQTRLYAKPIKAGKNKDGIELSKEEATCIKTAKAWNKQ